MKVSTLWAVMVVVHVATVVCAAKTGTDLNAEALEFAYKGDMQHALPLFQQAVATAPKVPEFHNNLGVTYLRMSQYDEARASFEEALRLEPGHTDAIRNLEEMAELLGDEDEDQGLQHTIIPIPRIPITELYSPENVEFATGQRPFIITGAMEDDKWLRARATWSADYFASKFPDSVTDFYPQNMDKETVRPFLTPWRETLREYHSPTNKFPKSKSHPGVYIQWNLGMEEWRWLLDEEVGLIPPRWLVDEAWLEGCLDSNKLRTEYCKETHWRMILIGNEGAGMFNHQDTLRTSSFQAQVTGSKTWHLCAPDQSRYMYGAGKVDFFRPNYRRFPLAREATCYKYTIRAGEMMYYPRDWWHQTYNEEGENIAITGTIVDGLNFDSVSEELAKDSEREKPIIMAPSPELKKALPGCYAWLQEAYGGKLA